MVSITKSLLFLLGAAIATSAAAPAPEYTPQEMAKVIDCQVQCINNAPLFGNTPSINVRDFMKRFPYGRMPYLVKNMQAVVKPCLKELRGLKGDASKVTKENFERYVLCNSKTLTKNEEVYRSKNFNWKKAGFTQKQWTEFDKKTLPAFRSALHTCRGGCRRIHFAKKGPPAMA
ncbi:hypothetical protein BGW42_006999 [Actinomortierella wolfii]|nr:hypothetical protein BGW42_006999 [Actinomortierella wolfii]